MKQLRNQEQNWSRNRRHKAFTGLHNGARPPLLYARGITLILVLVLLVITAAASVYFHNSMVSSTRISGANRDNSASLLLAESAMEMLRGRLLNNLDDDYGGESDTCADSCELHQIVIDESLESSFDIETALGEADYVYFTGDGSNGLKDQTRPSVLQKVANGEATGSSNPLTSQEVTASIDEILVQDLFSGGAPMLYTTQSNGLLVESTFPDWNAQKAADDYNSTIAATWAEITLNPNQAGNPGAMDLWVQAAAQVGMSKSYLQRYVGTFYPPAAGGGLSDVGVLLEAANFDRRIVP